ncbi:hypothetical protein lerEdw1_012817 [Lerista edwardsae]|nr:hypothetical protein lerEdw1_012817 [Lerista edwardsae]
MSLNELMNEEENFEYDCNEVYRNSCNENLDILEEVLCAERVGQMTKTYNDIDAVTRLLEEASILCL